MGNRIAWGAQLRERGYSIIEVMVAMALLAFIAIALLPAMLTLSDSLKLHAFRSQCNAIVRAKLQEYVNGVSATGTMGNSDVGSGYVASGFEYTKKRFFENGAGSETVNGATNYYCQVENVSAGHPGFRERLSSNRIISYTEAEDPTYADVPDRLRGFQLFTNIRHFNPRVIAGLQPRRQCPAGSTYTTPADYQFFRLGDALEVVVTGMIRVRPSVLQSGRNGAKFAGLDDKDDYTPSPRLVCSGSQIIYPPRVPFRYYLGSDGKIRNFQATLSFIAGAPASSLEAMEAHFRTLWSQVPTGTGTINDKVFPNIRSFAVSPENNSVYILKPGELKRYASCSDASLTMVNSVPANVTIPKVPDCSLTVNVTTWNVPGNIDNIAVDFQDMTDPTVNDDKVYGLFNTGGNTAGDVVQLDISAPPNALTPSVVPFFTVPTSRPRIRGIFIAPTFPPLAGTSAATLPNLFFFDNTCSAGSAGTAEENHCVSVFNSADTLMARPMRELPIQVDAISY